MAKIKRMSIQNMSVDDARKMVAGFEIIKDGALCSVEKSVFISDVNVKWVFVYNQYNNPTTGRTEVERLRSNVERAYARRMTFHDVSREDGYILEDGDGEKYYRGLLCKNIDGVMFIVVIREDFMVEVLLNNSEAKAWCEDHLSTECYCRLFR